MKVVLINPYELGRQPFGLAEPAAWLKREGCTVECLDLSLQMLEPEVLAGADLVAIYVAMHTATRIAMAALPRIKQLAPDAHLCVYGLYAPMNEAMLRKQGVATVLGGEVEPALVSLVQRLKQDKAGAQSEPVVSLAKIDFILPDRTGLPELSRYAHLITPEGGSKCIVFSTHIMQEVERLCDRVVVIAHGRSVASGTVPELLAQTGERDFEEAFVKLAFQPVEALL